MKKRRLKYIVEKLEQLTTHARVELPDIALREQLGQLRKTISGEPEYEVPLREKGHVAWVPTAILIIERQRDELSKLRREIGDLKHRHRANACGFGQKK